MEEEKLPKWLSDLSDKEIELVYDWVSHDGFNIFIDKIARSWKNQSASADAIAALNSIDKYALEKNSLLSAGAYNTYVRIENMKNTIKKLIDGKSKNKKGSSQK